MIECANLVGRDRARAIGDHPLAPKCKLHLVSPDNQKPRHPQAGNVRRRRLKQRVRTSWPMGMGKKGHLLCLVELGRERSPHANMQRMVRPAQGLVGDHPQNLLGGQVGCFCQKGGERQLIKEDFPQPPFNKPVFRRPQPFINSATLGISHHIDTCLAWKREAKGNPAQRTPNERKATRRNEREQGAKGNKGKLKAKRRKPSILMSVRVLF